MENSPPIIEECLVMLEFVTALAEDLQFLVCGVCLCGFFFSHKVDENLVMFFVFVQRKFIFLPAPTLR